MAQVKIVLGRASTGKSRWIARSLKAELEAEPFGPKLYWVTPTDASFTAEKLLMSAVRTTIRAEVITLQRLAERINQHLGIMPGAPINQTGKRMLLGEVYAAAVSDLHVLGKVRPTLGFLDAILDVFEEMSAHLVALDQIAAALEIAASDLDHTDDPIVRDVGRSLLGKLRDLTRLYFHYQRALEHRNQAAQTPLYDPGELMSWLTPRLADAEDLADATLYVDGFSDMTPRELSFVMGLAAVAKETVIVLSLDEAWAHRGGDMVSHGSSWDRKPPLVRLLERVPGGETVYGPATLALYIELVAACEAHGLSVEVLSIGELQQPPQGLHPALNTLERHLFAAAGSATAHDSSPVHLVAAQNVRVEADGVAEEIARLVRTQGHAFADVAVLVPSLTDYAAYLQESFERYDVKAYIEHFPSFGTYPLTKFVLSVLQSLKDNFSLDAMQRLLKSDFCGLSRDAADWLEGYLLRYDISGVRDWFDPVPWSYGQRKQSDPRHRDGALAEDAHAETLRTQLTSYLRPLERELQRVQNSPRQFAQAIWDLLKQTDAKKIVAQWMVNDDASQSPLEASLHEQAWQKLMAVINDLSETLPDAPLPTSFLIDAFRNDLMNQTLSSIPAGVDEVIVTEFPRANGLHAKIVFVLGLSDGVLPRRIRERGLLQDDERMQFWRLFGRRLGYVSEERQLAERLTVYTVLTRAMESLYLTYPLSGADGKEVRPSMLIETIRGLFPGEGLKESLWTQQDVTRGHIYTPTIAVETVVSGLSQLRVGAAVDPAVLFLFDWLDRHPVYRQSLGHGLRGFMHQTEAPPLAREVAAELYRVPLKLNAYQIETFASCPYRHFVQYGLRLKEQETLDVTAAARGTLIHDSLLEFVNRQLGRETEWAAMTDDEVMEAMHEVFAEVVNNGETGLWSKTQIRRQQANEALKVVQDAAIILTRHTRHGLFRPHAMELAFGDGERLPSFEVDVGDGVKVLLRGRIDRVDVFEQEGRRAFRIIDYKSSIMDIDLNKVEHGLRLQLPLYSAVVESYAKTLFGGDAESAGMLYIPLVRKAIQKNVPDPFAGARAESLKQMKSKGLLLADETYIEWMDARLVSGQASDLFAKVFKKDGSLSKTAPVLNQSEWRGLMARVAQHVRDFAARILAGDIAISPYFLSASDNACRFCAHSVVCQIDRRWDSRQVRFLESSSREELTKQWTQLSEEGAR